MINQELEENKIKKFLDIKLNELKLDLKTNIQQFTNVFKNSLELLDSNNQSQIGTLAKKELFDISYDEIKKENFYKLQNLNEHFLNIYTILESNQIINLENTDISTQKSLSDTFALPTVTEMFGILPLFAGNSNKISQTVVKILKKNKEDRNNDESDELEKYISSILEEKSQVSYAEGKEDITKTGMILVCDNPAVKADANITEEQFKNKEGFITFIKNTYGVEGLRHFLALLIGMEEAGRTGSCKISVNEHLERLGYKIGQNGSYKYELKELAIQIIYILCSLQVTIIKKKDKRRAVIENLKLFNLEGYKNEFEHSILINRQFIVSTTDWYKKAFISTKEVSPKYTKLLKSLVHESHKDHAITIYLTTLLGVFWRMKPIAEFKVSTLMEWCDINPLDDNRYRILRNMQSELNYMKEKNYIGEWQTKSEIINLTDSDNPFEEILILTPPNWLIKSLEKVNSNSIEKKQINEKVQIKIPDLIDDKDSLSMNDFNSIYEKSGLTIKDFCELIDISPRMFHLVRKGERNISTKVYSRLIEKFPQNHL